MTLSLTSAEQARFAATARALLSPLDQPRLDEWRAQVLEHLTELLEADAGGFILEAPGEARYTLWNLPDEFGREYFDGGWEAETSRELMREMGGGVWSTRLFGERLGLQMPDGFYRTDEYQGFYSRYGIRDAIGFMALPDPPRFARGRSREATAPPALAEAMLTCFRHVFGTEYFGERGLELLRLLLPALEAGVTTRMRLAGKQLALEALFDTAPYGVVVYGLGERRPLYRNAVFASMLDEDPECRRLRATIGAVVLSLSSLIRSGSGIGTNGLGSVTREMRTLRGRYRLRLGLIGEGLFASRRTVVATVERLRPSRPSTRALRDRWNLTPQEVRVARLLVRGWTNRRIAAAMHLSTATTRHYTETLFLKLGVHSRAEATSKILLT